MIQNILKWSLGLCKIIGRTLQILIVYILSFLTSLVQFNNSKFKNRWAFETVDWDSDEAAEDNNFQINVFKTIKLEVLKIWKFLKK